MGNRERGNWREEIHPIVSGTFGKKKNRPPAVRSGARGKKKLQGVNESRGNVSGGKNTSFFGDERRPGVPVQNSS